MPDFRVLNSASMRGTRDFFAQHNYELDALSPAFAKLGGLRVGDEAQVERLARESVAFLRGTDS